MQAIPSTTVTPGYPPSFTAYLIPHPWSSQGPIRVNRALATYLGLDPDWLASPEGTAVIAGNEIPPGAEPIAAVYAGHQFGSYNPQLGGRPRNTPG